MVAVDIFLMVLMVAAVVAGVTAISSSRAQKRELQAGPTMQLTAANRELVQAVRLLDRVTAADDMMPQLPSEIRNDIKKFLDEHYASQ